MKVKVSNEVLDECKLSKYFYLGILESKFEEKPSRSSVFRVKKQIKKENFGITFNICL